MCKTVIPNDFIEYFNVRLHMFNMLSRSNYFFGYRQTYKSSDCVTVGLILKVEKRLYQGKSIF